jgi:hypothetical protein
MEAHHRVGQNALGQKATAECRDSFLFLVNLLLMVNLLLNEHERTRYRAFDRISRTQSRQGGADVQVQAADRAGERRDALPGQAIGR